MHLLKKTVPRREDHLGSFGGAAPNRAMIFMNLKDIRERKGKGHSASTIINSMRGPLGGIREAIVVPFQPPPIAFILGVLPLVFASGAGSAGRHSVGTTVFGGMLVSTFLNLVIIPILYVVVRSLLPATAARSQPVPEPGTD